MSGGAQEGARVSFSIGLAAVVILGGCATSRGAKGEAGQKPAPAQAEAQSQKQAPTGQAAVLIHRPAAEVFEAIVNPAITQRFWFEKSSGRLEPGKPVRWTFHDDVSAQVAVRAFEPNRRLVIDWWAEGQHPTTVTWVLTPKGEGTTLLSVTQSGFVGDPETVAAQANDATGGFSLVLAGLKAYLEHEVQSSTVQERIGCPRNAATAAKAQASVGSACLLIHKPAAEVFEALVDPAITSKFWFARGSGRLEPGKQVRWTFPGNVSAQVEVRKFEPNRRLVLDWWLPGQHPTTLEWVLTPKDAGSTFVSVTQSGFVGDSASIADQANYSTGGFTFVLSWFKAYLEDGLRPNFAEYFERAQG